MIRFESVSKSFGRARALDEATFRVRPGTLTAVLGADGAGKSTLLKLALGLVRPDAGRVLFKDRPVADVLREVRRSTGYMPGNSGLYPDLTVGETLEFTAAIYGLPRSTGRARAAQLLGSVGLAPFSGRRVGALSGGMRQKLALCAALVPGPEVLLLDEPTAGIDPLSRTEMFERLARLAGDGMAIMMTTSTPEEASRADFLVHLWNGRVLLSGPVPDLEAGSGRILREVILESETAAERGDPR